MNVTPIARTPKRRTQQLIGGDRLRKVGLREELLKRCRQPGQE